MGWLTVKHSGNVFEDLKNTMIGRGYSIVAHNKKGNCIYTAIKNEETGKVFGYVFLFVIEDKEISFKEIDETCGPLTYGASKKVINALSHTTDKTALNWRKKCLLSLEKFEKYTFERPVICEDKEYKEFIFYGRNLFKPIGENFLIRIRDWKDCFFKED